METKTDMSESAVDEVVDEMLDALIEQRMDDVKYAHDRERHYNNFWRKLRSLASSDQDVAEALQHLVENHRVGGTSAGLNWFNDEDGAVADFLTAAKVIVDALSTHYSVKVVDGERSQGFSVALNQQNIYLYTYEFTVPKTSSCELVSTGEMETVEVTRKVCIDDPNEGLIYDITGQPRPVELNEDQL